MPADDFLQQYLKLQCEIRVISQDRLDPGNPESSSGKTGTDG